MKHLLVLSPYHSGSHKAWAEGYKKFSRHNVRILSLPGRFWKWRMHGGSVTLAKYFLNNGLTRQSELDESHLVMPDLILATDMTDLTTFLALARNVIGNIPVALYMHENQLTYPLPSDGSFGPMRRQKGERDLHYAFVNYASMLVANHIFFNSKYHFDSVCDELPRFLKHFPDYNELETVHIIKEKSSIMPVGIDFSKFDINIEWSPPENEPPLILWNHRWEYDKNPASFFEAIYKLRDSGLPFNLAICGKQFRQFPAEFEEARARLAEHIVHFGYADEKSYIRLLRAANIVISTSKHEFFGISVLEAIYNKTFPILPYTLSYPEIVPMRFHKLCLYENSDELLQILMAVISEPESYSAVIGELSRSVKKYDWRSMASIYDRQLGMMIY